MRRIRLGLLGTLLAIGCLGLAPAIAAAGVGAGATPTFPTIVTVGQTGVPATIELRNLNTSPETADTNTVCNNGDAFPCPGGDPGITLIPSCGQLGAFSACVAADPGVFALSSTGTGQVGTACAGMTFAVTLIDPVFGQYRFTPQPGGTNLTLPGAGSLCVIGFTFDVVKSPNIDQNVVQAGRQTVQIIDNTQFSGFITASARGTSSGTTVLRANTSISSTASAGLQLGTGTLTDTAVVSDRVNPTAGGTVTFNLYGPGDPACAGAPIFSPPPVPYPVGGGPVTSPPFTPTQAGTHRWVASYSGDANNAPSTGACGDAGESADVAAAPTTIATTASPGLGLGAGTLTDTAVVSGRVNPVPGATITFTLYGPGDATCTGAPVFTPVPVPYPVAGGPVTSPAFTPTQAGTYRWIAGYSGDPNNSPAGGACNDAGESAAVAAAQPTIATTASANVALGAGTLSDTAVVSARVNPQAGATITWTLYGPGDATCAGTPVFSPSPVPYPVAGGPVTSPPFTPTQPGTYRWIAAYSGDPNNAPVSGACNDANETTTADVARPTIATTASANVALGAGTLTDTAVVSARVNPQAAATITWTLYGPGDATCAGTPVFSPAPAPYPVAGGPVTSPPFTPTQPGTYRWIAAYSGDANNAAVGGACNDANETTTVGVAQPTIATTASPDIVLSAGTLTDTAVVSGRVNPQAGATITFTLYGPGDATCSGAPAFSPAPVPYPVGGGPVTSPAFTPAQIGTWRWVAAYSGDANNAPVSGACNDSGETSAVALAAPTIATNASAAIAIGGGTLTDTAVVSGRVNPQAGATITFTLYGPGDATCSQSPAFSPAPVPYPVAGGPVTSPAYTPAQAGTYRWRAAYSGDANNLPASGACNDANETATVSPATPPPPPPPAPAPPPPPVPPVPPPPPAPAPPPPPAAAPPPPPPAPAAPPPPATPSLPAAEACTPPPGPAPPGSELCVRGWATITGPPIRRPATGTPAGGLPPIVGRSVCQGKPFRVTVDGRQIDRVLFTRDGKYVRLLTDPNLGNRWMLPVNPRVLPIGLHHIRARVIFLKQSGTRSRTLRVVFSRCGRRVTTAPSFTG